MNVDGGVGDDRVDFFQNEVFTRTAGERNGK